MIATGQVTAFGSPAGCASTRVCRGESGVVATIDGRIGERRIVARMPVA